MPLTRQVKKGGAAPAAGSVKRAGVGDKVWCGGQTFAGSARGGRERKGSVSMDGRKLSFRKLNRADPNPKNT